MSATTTALRRETVAALEGRRIEIRGTVQGVGFRPWVYRLAQRHGVRGHVANDSLGVVIEAFAPNDRLEAFCAELATGAPAAARIDSLSWRTSAAHPVGDPEATSFEIVSSRESDGRRLSIPPDLATCDACRRELFDPADRRHGYPFINCTDCGPRFTIALDVPYDRPATTMASFALCPACRQEYEDPADRRFHAQPNACPDCGPRLWLSDAEGEVVAVEDPIAAAAAALAGGLIVAVKGLGGFHLAVDATCQPAVARLRERKRREAKPLAVMVCDLAAARRLAQIGDAEARLLTSTERPVVLLRVLAGSPLAASVAPDLALVGLMLPYTPLHHLLLTAAARPLVMTSGNLAQEPIAYRDWEALARLGEVADRFLLHDREIARPCDDSVTRVIAGAPAIVRRSRGWVPRPIRLSYPFDRPVLACGAHLKNTFCFGVGDLAYLGPHIGDLETVETFEHLEAAIETFERLLGVHPALVAHDLHPEYLSTVYARRRGLPAVAIQHHHAHVASAMAEHGLDGPVLGIAFDGVGLGDDGDAWGGELLLADRESYRRLATLRPIRLAGGDLAVREIWRLALAALDDAFDGEPPLEQLDLFRGLPRDRVATVRTMLRWGVHSPPAHGAGRWFDAIGALLLAQPQARWEGQAALGLELAATPGRAKPYPWRLSGEPGDRAPRQIDLRPAVRALTVELLAGRPAAILAARFHDTLAAATADAALTASGELGSLPVVLTGGCFQNRRLSEELDRRLSPHTTVHHHRQVPAGDGGIALGQAVVADARTRRRPPCV